MEHGHRCVYCRADWFCHDDCPMAGPSVCDDCREKLLDAPPETPVRVIALDRASVVLGTLARYDAQRLTREIKRRERPE